MSTEGPLPCVSCGCVPAEDCWTGLCEQCGNAPTVVVVRPDTAEGGDSTSDDVPCISKHRLLEKIGRGGMGTVYRGHQDSLQRDVAVKVVNASHDYAANVERFAREAHILAQLDHPNIVPVYDYGTDPQGRRAYTMKLVRGQTLQALLKNLAKGTESTSLQRLLRVFRKVCDAMEFAHSRGIIHRDLKPDNIMVGEFGEVLVMDWGLALELTRDTPETFSSVISAKIPAPGEAPAVSGSSSVGTRDSSLTLEGEVLGTPQYMSPEQANGIMGIDARADVYALGGILYSILSLRPPVPRGEFHEMLANVRKGSIEPFELERSMLVDRPELWRIPPALLSVVRKAMALDPAQRFQTVGGLGADIEAYVGGFATSAEKIGLAGQLWLLIKRHKTFAAATALIIVLTFAFILRLVASEQRASENEKIAQSNEAAAVLAEKNARSSAEAARISAARARTAQADSAFSASDPRQLREALTAVPADLRDTLWHYLDTHADDRRALIKWQGDGFHIGCTPHPTKSGVFAVATSPNYRLIVEYDARTGNALKSFPIAGGFVRGLAYSPDHKRLAVGRIMEGDIFIHDAESGAELRRWDTDWVESLQYLPKRAGKPDALLRTKTYFGCDLWDPETGKLIWENPHGTSHHALPGGEQFVSVEEHHLRIHSSSDGQVITDYPLKAALAQTASLSPDGRILVVAHRDGRMRAHALADSATVFDAAIGEDATVLRTAFTPNGKNIVTVASIERSGSVVQLLDVKTGRYLRRLRGGLGQLESISIHPLSAELLLTSEISATWSLPSFRDPVTTLESGPFAGFLGGSDMALTSHPADGFVGVALPRGETIWRASRRIHESAITDFAGRIALAEAAGTVTVHNFLVFRAENGRIRETGVVRYPGLPEFMAVNCDATRAAFAATERDIRAYNIDADRQFPNLDQQIIRTNHALAWHGSDPKKLIGLFSQEGKRGTANAQEWIVVWDTDTGKRVHQLQSESARNCLDTEPRGNRIAEGGDDKFVRIRDADSLAVLREFRAHDAPLHAVAWNPAFPILATSASDRAIRLWDVESGRMIAEVAITLHEATTLRFSPDGRRLVAVTPGTRTNVWEFPNLEADLKATRTR